MITARGGFAQPRCWEYVEITGFFWIAKSEPVSRWKWFFRVCQEDMKKSIGLGCVGCCFQTCGCGCWWWCCCWWCCCCCWCWWPSLLGKAEVSPPYPPLLNCFLPRHQWQTTPRSGRSGRSSHVPFQSCPSFYSPGTVGFGYGRHVLS